MTVSALKPLATNTRVQHELLSVDSLTIDSRVQRKEGVKASRVASIADNFNPDALGSITVSRRKNGTLVILDGAHRCEAARIAEYTSPLHALVYDGLTLAQEAAMFNLLNTFQAPSFISRTLAKVVAGDREATDIVHTIEGHGWKIGLNSDNGWFSAVQAAERVYRNGVGTLDNGEHPELLDQTMAFITTTWHHDRESAHQMIVLGIGQLFARFGDAVDVTKLSKALAQERPYNVISHAKAMQAYQGGTTPSALARVVVGMNNKGRRVNLLPEWVWTR